MSGRAVPCFSRRPTMPYHRLPTPGLLRAAAFYAVRPGCKEVKLTVSSRLAYDYGLSLVWTARATFMMSQQEL